MFEPPKSRATGAAARAVPAAAPEDVSGAGPVEKGEGTLGAEEAPQREETVLVLFALPVAADGDSLLCGKEKEFRGKGVREDADAAADGLFDVVVRGRVPAADHAVQHQRLDGFREFHPSPPFPVLCEKRAGAFSVYRLPPSLLGIFLLMSASEGEVGSWKSRLSKGGCMNFIVNQIQMRTRGRGSLNLKTLWTSYLEAPLCGT